MLPSISGARRVKVVLLVLLCSIVLVLPAQSRQFLQQVGIPFADVVAVPLRALTALEGSIQEVWNKYVALQNVHEENRRLHEQIEILRNQNHELRELAFMSHQLSALLEFKGRLSPETVAAQVIGLDSTNWYRGVVLNKGQQQGIRAEMGVLTLSGVVGRVVKATKYSSVVLLVNDPNNAVPGLIQRTRDQGIVVGTIGGRARMRYIPLLSTVKLGDVVATSGLTGAFPKGIPIGTISRIEKEDDDLFLSAEIVPEVDFTKLEEVLVITALPTTAEETSEELDGATP